MSVRSCLCAIFALLLFSPKAVLAWHAAGHEAVAAIAWRDLDAGTRGRVAALLRQHQDFQGIAPSVIAASGVDAEEFFFLKAAVWPDEIRSDDHPSRFFHVRDWHFKDLPFNPSEQPGLKLHASSEDAIKTLALCEAVLKNPEAAPASKTMALCWLFHLAGDVHQPLHAVALLSSDFPEGDAGGNLFYVKTAPDAPATNLHSFWDGLFDAEDSFQRADTLASGIRLQHKRADLLELNAHPAFADWLGESFQLARESAYEFTNAQGVWTALRPGVRAGSGFLPGKEPQVLPEGYAAKADAIARKRIALAGYRLADTLKRLFPPAP